MVTAPDVVVGWATGVSAESVPVQAAIIKNTGIITRTKNRFLFIFIVFLKTRLLICFIINEVVSILPSLPD